MVYRLFKVVAQVLTKGLALRVVGLNLIELKRYYRNLPNYELGKKAGITLDIFARKKKGEEELLDESVIKRRMTFAVSRYLQQAKYLIQNVEQGIFPCITKPKSN
jgi:hypothetical protein